MMRPTIATAVALLIFLGVQLMGCAGSKDPIAGPADKSKGNELPAPTPAKPTTEQHRAACAGIDRAGCKEAHPKSGTCEGDLAQAEGYGEVVDLPCYAKAAAPDDVRKCGGPGLYTVRCLP
jgi:hypothetical protein